MAASQVPNLTSTRIAVFCVILLSMGDRCQGINLGLFAGDNKKHSNPLLIRKVSKLSPVFININSGLPRLSKPSLPLPRLPIKLPPLRLLEPKLPNLKRQLGRKVPRSLLTTMIIPPLIPNLPILPIVPPFLPHLLPLLPILPIPFLPPLWGLPKLPKPIKVPILGKSPLQRTLGSELNPIVVPLARSIAATINKKVLGKLLELKEKGSLTTAEFIRFKKLLLRK